MPSGGSTRTVRRAYGEAHAMRRRLARCCGGSVHDEAARPRYAGAPSLPAKRRAARHTRYDAARQRRVARYEARDVPTRPASLMCSTRAKYRH